ncbi:MAG: PQQ-like beta-propeller repeat protein [Pirellulaceae bacterium]|nr:PQQ-like beta-propeller repeat protein [Pirellulaceae bacterium]
MTRPQHIPWPILILAAGIAANWLPGVVLAEPIIAQSAADFESWRDANWHHWRGPRADGVAPGANPPLNWDPQTNVRWRTPLPGEGSSTPIVWQNQIFLAAAVPTDRKTDSPPQPAADAKTVPPDNYYEFLLLAFDRDSGALRWRQKVCEQVPHEGQHPTNTYASASPTTDGQRIYVSFGSRGIYCLDLSGKLLWSRDLGRMRTRYGWGEATTPVLHGDWLIVNWDHEDQSYLFALDAATGQTRWQVERDEPTSWATPLVVQHGETTQVVVNGTNRARGYDLRTGEVLWQCGGQTVNAIPSPVRWNDWVICMSGYRGAAAHALPLDARGDLTDSDQVPWRYGSDTPYVPSPVIVDGRLYFTRSNSQVLSCLDVATGKPIFEPQRLPGLSSLYASPVSAAGRIYFTDRDGTTLVIQAGDRLEVLATNRLDEPIDASPALVGRQLFLRSSRHLYCIEEQPLTDN